MQELRRVELGRVSGERFQCPAPVLPRTAGFDGAAVGTPADEAAAHERLLRERERLGAVNLVADAELAAEFVAADKRFGARHAGCVSRLARA